MKIVEFTLWDISDAHHLRVVFFGLQISLCVPCSPSAAAHDLHSTNNMCMCICTRYKENCKWNTSIYTATRHSNPLHYHHHHNHHQSHTHTHIHKKSLYKLPFPTMAHEYTRSVM